MQPTPTASYSLTLRVKLSSRAGSLGELTMTIGRAGIITDAELHPEYIVPSVFDKRVAEVVAREVEAAAHRTGVARRGIDVAEIT